MAVPRISFNTRLTSRKNYKSILAGNSLYLPIPINYLVVAGGGGGDWAFTYQANGGAGAGGMLTGSTNLYKYVKNTITIGTGGGAGLVSGPVTATKMEFSKAPSGSVRVRR